MKNVFKRIFLSIALFLISANAYSQLELKTGVSGSFFASSNATGQLGTHLELAYSPEKFYSIGLFGSYGKVFSSLEKNHIFATGVVFELRGYFNEEMKIVPLMNIHVGHSWEYKKNHYTYGDNNQYHSDIDKHIKGVSLALRCGIVSNFTKTGPFQFQFDVGLLEQSRKLSLAIFDVETQKTFLQTRLLLVYSL